VSRRLKREISEAKWRERYVFTDGLQVEWPDYICYFEQGAHWNGWSKQKIATQISMSFERDREITSDVLFYYERFKFALSQRLYPPERETEFRNRRRKREAVLLSFA
jgi:hypothetical protein